MAKLMLFAVLVLLCHSKIKSHVINSKEINYGPVGLETHDGMDDIDVDGTLSNRHGRDSGSASVVINKPGGSSPSATVSASVPIVNDKNTQITLGGSTTFGHGMKPNSQVGLTIEHKF